MLNDSLKHKIVLITGASSGIGKACAEAFAGAGAALILCARRKERLEELAKHLENLYETKSYLICLDVQDKAAVHHAISQLPTEWQSIDIIINNAGLALGLDKIQDGQLSDWEQMIDTNIKGLLYMTRCVLPGMLQRNQGHIINISSVSAHYVYSGGAVYCATKHAVKAITEGLQLDLLGTNLKVTAIDPGMVHTEFSLVRYKGHDEKAKKTYDGLTPLSAKDVAETVLFCATRPAHVNIATMIVLPTAQRSGTQIYRDIKN